MCQGETFYKLWCILYILVAEFFQAFCDKSSLTATYFLTVGMNDEVMHNTIRKKDTEKLIINQIYFFGIVLSVIKLRQKAKFNKSA